MPYIHFTEEQKAQAASVDLEAFLRSRGEKLNRSGRDKRLGSDHSITVNGSRWYDHAAQQGGGPISFVQTFYRLSYPEAVSLLLGDGQGRAYPAAREKEAEPPKPFALPPASRDMRHVYAYLIKTRGICRDVVAHFAKEGLIYEDAQHHNCVFVGTDPDGTARHAQLRSTSPGKRAFRINVEGGDPHHSFHHLGTDEQLYVFEAPIDLLSYITLHPQDWQSHSYVACCGTSFLPVEEMLGRLPQMGEVFLCLDNDRAGHAACERMGELLSGRDVSVVRLIPQGKDWNDDLRAAMTQTQAQPAVGMALGLG